MAPFDPTSEAKKNYMQSGMKPADYNSQRLDWLKRMAASEGKEYKPGYVPQGYTKIQASPLNTLREKGKPFGYTETWRYSSVNGKKPDALFWKPDAFAQHRPDLPAAKWDYTKDIQNYWHNPTNVISWHEHFRVQDEGYEPPTWLNKDFVEEQYKALKAYNDYEDDPLYWKPLPIGSEAAYASNFGTDPNGNTPIYEQVAEQLSQPEAVAARYREQTAQAQQIVTGLEDKDAADIQELLNEINTSPDAMSGLAKLEGKVTPEFYNDFKAYLKEEKIIPYEEGEVAPGIEEPGGEGGSYSELYGWQKLAQTLGSTAEMKNRPASSKTVADILGALIPAVGIGGMAAQLGTAITAINAFATTGSVVAAATGVGIPVAIAIKIVAGLLTAGTAYYLYSQKDNPNNTAVQKIFAPFQVGAEHTERAIGAVGTAATLIQEDKPVDIRAAYDAGFVNNELHSPSGFGDFVLDAASVIGEWVDKLGAAFGADWNISGGETTEGNEVWMLDEGYKEPVEAEIPLGKEGMLVAYDAMRALGDDRTRNEMMIQWAYLTSLTGSSGTFNDYIAQNILDPMNFIPNLEDAGLAQYAKIEAQKAIKAGDPIRATAFTTLQQAAKGGQGNLLLDALPMGAQQVGKAFAQRFETAAAWAYSNKVLGEKVSLKDFSKTYIPSIRDSMGIGDVLNIYNARMETGYNNLANREYVMRIGGKIENTVRLKPFTDGSLKILNIDGSKSWDYTKENLAKIGVTFVNDADGNLTIKGVSKLMADAGIKGRVAADEINTRINIQPTTEDFDSIDPTGADYQPQTDPATFVVKKDNKTYTIDAVSGEVKSAVDADGKPVTFAKKTVWGERPVIIGNEVYSPALAAVMGDYITLANKSYEIATNRDFRSHAEVKAEGLRGKLTGLNSGLVNKAIDWYTSLSELTPGNKALLEAENLREAILFMHMFSGNNFELTMRAIKKMVGGADVGEIAKAAEQFINQSGTIASVSAAMKVAFGDNSQADMFVQIYKDTLPKRAYIAKVSKEIDVDQHKLLEMSGQSILDKLKNRLAPKTDATSLALMEDIASGRVNAKMIEDAMSPFKGKDALPLTDADFLATVTIFADKAIQDYLIEKYNIKKLDTWTRLSSMKKALLSPLLIGMPYTTWMNNLWSNLGAQFFLLGEAPLTGKTAMDEFVKSLGIEALPFSPSERFGLASDVIDSTSKISLLLNPNDSIGKVTRTLRDFGGAFKAYSKIEQFNTSALFLAEVLNMQRRIDLPGMPENIKARMSAADISPEKQKFIQKMLNRTKSVAEMEKIFTSGTEYDAVGVGLIEAAADALSQNNPDRANVYKELMQKVANDEDFMAVASKVTDPKDVYRLREALDTALEKQLHVMLDESVRTWRFEVENIMSKEGMAGGINLMASAIFGELSHRMTNSASWGEAMQAADRAMAVGDYAQRTRIIRNQRTQAKASYERFFAMQDAQFKTMADVLQAGDANGKAFADIIAKRHGESSEVMAAIEKNYEDYFDAETNGVKAKWEETETKNTALMARLDKLEIENLKALAKLWTDMLGSRVGSNVAASGISATDLKRGGAKMMKKLIDGYTELNKLRTQHYADIKDLSAGDKRAAQMTFWNEVWQPQVGKLINGFSEDNWNTFFKVQTDFAKATYPTTPEPEAPPTPKTEVSAGDQAAQNVSNKVNRRKLSERAKATADAVHVKAAATHTTNAWYQHLDLITNLTPTQRTWADVWVHVLDDVNSAKAGKPSGSWLAELGTEAAQNADPNIPLGATIDGKLREAASVTRWNDVANKLKTLLSKNKTEATFLKDIDRIISELPLPADVDKNLVIRSLIKHIMTKEVQSKFTDFKLSDAVKGVYERLQLENDTAELQARNAARMKAAPTGNDAVAELPEVKIDKLNDRLDAVEGKLQPSLFENETELSKADSALSSIAKDALELRKEGATPEIDSVLTRTDQLMTAVEAKPAQKVAPTMPITEYPVGTAPVHMNTGAALNELYELNVPLMRDQMMDTLSQRMQASERPQFKMNLSEEGQAVLKDYLNIAKENQRVRMASILDAAKRVTKDVMIDYSRRRGIDQAVEMVFPYQFWFTRSSLMWLKRMVAKPAIAAAAYRYRELQRRNEMKGFPSRMGGKTPIYTPWLSEGMGDYMSVDYFSRFFTPEQLFQPVANYANLDAEVTEEAQRYIQELLKQKVISKQDAEKAVTTMSGTIWEDALQYVKLNSMADKTDPFTIASMAINPDPFINIMYQAGRGTPEKINPMPLTRIGNSFQSIGGDTVLGIIGTMLSFPEDTIRKATGIPQAGEYGDYYVDFWLANMATYDKAPIEDIKNAMISREGALYEQAYLLAQQYIGLRTPGTPFFKAIKDGRRDPQALATAFLMSFMPTGLYPDGEMELRGLQDEYAAAWEDYERGDKEALEKFETAHPEYALRRMMFQEPTERLRGHLINIIWDKYTQLPSANRAIAADTLGDAFKAYFLDAKTQNYNAVDEGTLTTWAKQLGGMVPSTPDTEMQAEQTVAPLKLYPEDKAAVIQAFSDERKAKFPDYWLYQGVFYGLTKDKQDKFLKQVPMLQRYWDWKKAQGEANPILKSYFEDLSNNSKSGSYDTEYDAEAAADYMKAFDEELLKKVLIAQAMDEPLPAGAKAELNTLFQLAGKPGGDFKLWLKVLLGE